MLNVHVVRLKHQIRHVNAKKDISMAEEAVALA